jgi:predicted DNA-binding transcriptional regulator AlpA
MIDKFARPAHACERLSVSRSTLYRMIEQGHLPSPVRISARCVGWPESQIQAVIDQKTSKK